MSENHLTEDQLYRLVSQFHARYVRIIDDDQLESWPDLFADDCRYIITNADNHRRGLQAGLVYADSKGMLRDRISALRDANIYEQHSYRHIVGHPLLEAWNGHEIRTETSFLVARIMRTGTTDLYASGRYLDRYRLVEGDLRLSERVVVCDSHVIDTLLALPL